jgi:hypothetical protein
MRTQKSKPSQYQFGRFRVQKTKSRWRVIGGARRDFSTLGGARAWCQHQSKLEPTPRV